MAALPHAILDELLNEKFCHKLCHIQEHGKYVAASYFHHETQFRPRSLDTCISCIFQLPYSGYVLEEQQLFVHLHEQQLEPELLQQLPELQLDCREHEESSTAGDDIGNEQLEVATDQQLDCLQLISEVVTDSDTKLGSWDKQLQLDLYEEMRMGTASGDRGDSGMVGCSSRILPQLVG